MRHYFQRTLNKIKRDGICAAAVAVIRRGLGIKAPRMDYMTKGMLQIDNYKDRFSKIYRDGSWATAESSSGVGSGVAYTENLRDWLPSVIQQHDVRTIVDAPCGDFNWMIRVLPGVDVKYFGFDIVEDLIEQNRRRHAQENIEFGVADICSDTLPDCDLLLVRDCLFHLSYRDIDRFLQNIKSLDYKYLLTTTHIVEAGFANQDIETGDFRPIDLFAKPFRLIENRVVDRVDDFPVGHPLEREMVLIRKVDVPTSIYG